MRVRVVSVGSEQYQLDFVQKEAREEQKQLLTGAGPIESAQASFEILRLSFATRLGFILRKAYAINMATEKFDKYLEWAPVYTIAWPGAWAEAEGLAPPEEAREHPSC